MSHTLYATFARPEEAERAAGALLDHGVRAEDLSVVKQPGYGENLASEPKTTASNVVQDPNAVEAAPVPTGSVYGVPTDPADLTAERSTLANGEATADEIAKNGLTTTTVGDAGAGAVQGTIIGVGLGAIAAIASLIIPGVGIVLGAGALASALGGVAATAGAGAAAGAVVGYLKDMGVDDHTAGDYGRAIEDGGAVLAVALPSGDVDEEVAKAILNKYAATNVNRYASRGYVA